MKVLLTGATGFVGSHVARILSRCGHEVTALVRSEARSRFLEEMGIARLFGSLENTEDLKGRIPEVEGVIHLAGLIKAKNPAEFYKTNTEGTRNLLALLCGQKLKSFVFVSSISARGPNRFLGDHEGAGPVSHYGRSKLAAEDIARQGGSGFPVVIFRPPVVYGPGDRETFLLFKMFKKGFLPIVRGGKNRVSFVFVDDLARTLVQALTGTFGPGPYYPEDGHEGLSWLEIHAMAERLYGKRIRKIPVPLWGAAVFSLVNEACRRASIFGRDKYRELKQPLWICSGKEWRETFNLLRTTSLEEGFKVSREWYEKEGWI